MVDVVRSIVLTVNRNIALTMRAYQEDPNWPSDKQLGELLKTLVNSTNNVIDQQYTNVRAREV